MKGYFSSILRFTIAALVMGLAFAPGAFATAEYASQTGRACGDCHLDAGGGGALTRAGEDYISALRIKGQYQPLTPIQRVVRFIVGFLHTLTAIAWFGTILYVHILLKPAYAAKGLPRGELMLGWASIIIMAVTGALLTISRVPHISMFYTTRFGILLLIKIVLYLVMVATAAFVTFVVGPRLKRKIALKDACELKSELTPDELARFDGKDGRQALVAYKGNIYDLSASRMWRDGSHARKHSAGADLTDFIKLAPHAEDRILKMPVVSRCIPSASGQQKPKLFYALAYLNLAIVFLIIFVISLWRWA